MKRNTLAYWIGLFIFGGLILQTFLQLELEKQAQRQLQLESAPTVEKRLHRGMEVGL